MPSSNARRCPARTLSAMGRSVVSVRIKSFKSFRFLRCFSTISTNWMPLIEAPLQQCFAANRSNVSNFPKRCSRSPEEQKRNTNITVHREKRSVQLAQIVGFHKRVFVGQQRRDHGNTGPG